MIIYASLAVACFTACLMIDFAHARYVRAMSENRVLHAANWSVIQWGAGCIGFVIALKVTLWLMPFEALGLYVGTYLGARKNSSLC